MTKQFFQIEPQKPSDDSAIEKLLDASFGIDRRTKTSYRLREGETPLKGLSFVAKTSENKIIGAISFWQIFIGEGGPDAILLGPLAVKPKDQGSGIGLALMKRGIKAARKRQHQLVILVGDAPYYAKVGFDRIPKGQIQMPGPNDYNRTLYLELEQGILATTSGLIMSPSRYLTAPFRNNPGNK